MNAKFNEITFSDADVVNLDDWIPAGSSNPHSVRPFLLHDHGFAVAVVFADCLQDALDEAADAGKLDRYKLNNETEESDSFSYLGNASEPYDIESLGVIELPNPPASFCAQFAAVNP